MAPFPKEIPSAHVPYGDDEEVEERSDLREEAKSQQSQAFRVVLVSKSRFEPQTLRARCRKGQSVLYQAL